MFDDSSADDEILEVIPVEESENESVDDSQPSEQCHDRPSPFENAKNNRPSSGSAKPPSIDFDSVPSDEPKNYFGLSPNQIIVCAAVLFFIVVCSFLNSRFFNPCYIILGSSMEPAWNGPVLRTECPECHRRFDVTVETETLGQLESFRKIGCPSCGFSEVPIRPESLGHGDWFSVGHGQNNHRPSRWNAVIFRYPEGEQGAQAERGKVQTLSLGKKKNVQGEPSAPFGLKRVVGLPEEKIEICRGDLLINDRIARKFPIAEPVGTAWRSDVFLGQIEAQKTSDRILFVQSVPVPFLAEEKRHNRGWHAHRTVLPIVNQPPNLRLEQISNQNLENVRDFVLKFSWRPEMNDSPIEPIQILANQGDRLWLVVMDWDQDRISIYQTNNKNSSVNHKNALSDIKPEHFLGETPIEAVFPPSVRHPQTKESAEPPKAFWVELRFCDRQAAILVDGRIATLADEAGDLTVWKNAPNQQISVPFAIILPSIQKETERSDDNATATLAERLQIDKTAVFRDAHYTSVSPRRVYNVPPEEYFLLGDNSAVSIDSRQWKNVTIPASDLKKTIKRR